jgi:hypothetical protein
VLAASGASGVTADEIAARLGKSILSVMPVDTVRTSLAVPEEDLRKIDRIASAPAKQC